MAASSINVDGVHCGSGSFVAISNVEEAARRATAGRATWVSSAVRANEVALLDGALPIFAVRHGALPGGKEAFHPAAFAGPVPLGSKRPTMDTAARVYQRALLEWDDTARWWSAQLSAPATSHEPPMPRHLGEEDWEYRQAIGC